MAIADSIQRHSVRRLQPRPVSVTKILRAAGAVGVAAAIAAGAVGAGYSQRILALGGRTRGARRRSLGHVVAAGRRAQPLGRRRPARRPSPLASPAPTVWSGVSSSSTARARPGGRGSCSCGWIPAASHSRWLLRSWKSRDGPSSDAGDTAALALDAGQFRGSLPWGWVVTGGKEILAPQHAPLAGAVVVDAAGRIRIVSPDSVAAERERGTAREAFQSYPMLLDAGTVPAPLVQPGLGVDLEHRDGRLALGTLEDGRVIVALTRFDALGGALGRVPFGLTSPEMAAVMGALGCRQALLLDGGISGQLLVRDSAGVRHTWSSTRRVPLGLVGQPRP